MVWGERELRDLRTPALWLSYELPSKVRSFGGHGIELPCTRLALAGSNRGAVVAAMATYK